MANKVELSVALKTHISNLRETVKTLENEMGKVDVGSSIGKGMQKAIDNAKKELGKVGQVEMTGVKNQTDLENLYSRLKNISGTIDFVKDQFSDLGIKDLNLNHGAFAEAKKDLNNLTKELENFQRQKEAIEKTSVAGLLGASEASKLRISKSDQASGAVEYLEKLKQKSLETKTTISDLEAQLKALQAEKETLDKMTSKGSPYQKDMLNLEQSARAAGGGKLTNAGIASAYQKELTGMWDNTSQSWTDDSKVEAMLKLVGLDKATVEAVMRSGEERDQKLSEFLNNKKNKLTSQFREGISGAKEIENAQIRADKVESDIANTQRLISTAKMTDTKTDKKINAVSGALEGKGYSQTNSAIQNLKTKIANLEAKINNIARQVSQTKTPGPVQGDSGTEMAIGKQEVGQQFDQAVQNFTRRWIGVHAIVNKVRQGIHQAWTDIQGLDKAMTNIAVVTDMSVNDLWGKINEYMSIAQQYGVTTQGVYEVSQLYYQQGLTTNEVMAATTETLKMARIAGMDYAAAADAMTVAIRSFKMEMEDAAHVTDVYSKVAAVTASDSEELATAMSKTASSAESVGSSFENTTAMLAVMIETTRESAQNLGSALKSIISRYGEMKSGLTQDSEGEEIDYNKTDAALRSVGISLKDAQGQFRDFDDVIFELSKKWDTLDKNTQRYIATVMAGNRQQSRFIALVDNWERLDEVSKAAENSEDAGLLQYSKTLDSLETKINNLKTSFQELYMSIANGPAFKGILDFINNILQGFTKIKGGLITFIPSLIVSVKSLFTIIGMLGKNMFAGLYSNAKNAFNQVGNTDLAKHKQVEDEKNKITETAAQERATIEQSAAAAENDAEVADHQATEQEKNNITTTDAQNRATTEQAIDQAKNDAEVADDQMTEQEKNNITATNAQNRATTEQAIDQAENDAEVTDHQVTEQEKLNSSIQTTQMEENTELILDKVENDKEVQDHQQTELEKNAISTQAETQREAAELARDKAENVQEVIDHAATEQKKSLLTNSGSSGKNGIKGFFAKGSKGAAYGGMALNMAGTALNTWGTSVIAQGGGKNLQTGSIMQAGGGVLSGAGMGLMMGGPWGALVGGLVGLVGSLPGLIKGLNKNNQLEADRLQAEKEADEANIKRAETKNEYDSLKALIEKVEKTEEFKNDSEEAYQEWVDANNALVEQYPELLGYIDEYGNSIADLTDKTEILSQKLSTAADSAADFYDKKIEAVNTKITENGQYEKTTSFSESYTLLGYSGESATGDFYKFLEKKGRDYYDFIPSMTEGSSSTTYIYTITPQIADEFARNNGFILDQTFLQKNQKDMTAAELNLFSALERAGFIDSDGKILDSHLEGFINAKQDKQELAGIQKSAAQSSISAASSLFGFDDDLSDIKGLVGLLQTYGLEVNEEEWGTDKLYRIHQNPNDYADFVKQFKKEYNALGETQKLMVNTLYDQIGEFSRSGLSNVLQENDLNPGSALYESFMTEWYKKNYNKDSRMIQALDEDFFTNEDGENFNIFRDKANDVTKEQDPVLYALKDMDAEEFKTLGSYSEWLKYKGYEDDAQAKRIYQTTVEAIIRNSNNELGNFIINSNLEIGEQYIKILRSQEKAIQSGGVIGREASDRMNKVNSILKEIYSDDNLTKLFGGNETLRNQYVELLLADNIGSKEWAEKIEEFEAQYGIDLANFHDYVLENFSIYIAQTTENMNKAVEDFKAISEIQSKGIDDFEKALEYYDKYAGDLSWDEFYTWTEDGRLIFKDINQVFAQIDGQIVGTFEQYDKAIKELEKSASFSQDYKNVIDGNADFSTLEKILMDFGFTTEQIADIQTWMKTSEDKSFEALMQYLKEQGIILEAQADFWTNNRKNLEKAAKKSQLQNEISIATLSENDTVEIEKIIMQGMQDVTEAQLIALATQLGLTYDEVIQLFGLQYNPRTKTWSRIKDFIPNGDETAKEYNKAVEKRNKIFNDPNSTQEERDYVDAEVEHKGAIAAATNYGKIISLRDQAYEQGDYATAFHYQNMLDLADEQYQGQFLSPEDVELYANEQYTNNRANIRAANPNIPISEINDPAQQAERQRRGEVLKAKIDPSHAENKLHEAIENGATEEIKYWRGVISEASNSIDWSEIAQQRNNNENKALLSDGIFNYQEVQDNLGIEAANKLAQRNLMFWSEELQGFVLNNRELNDEDKELLESLGFSPEQWTNIVAQNAKRWQDQAYEIILEGGKDLTSEQIGILKQVGLIDEDMVLNEGDSLDTDTIKFLASKGNAAAIQYLEDTSNEIENALISHISNLEETTFSDLAELYETTTGNKLDNETAKRYQDAIEEAQRGNTQALIDVLAEIASLAENGGFDIDITAIKAAYQDAAFSLIQSLVSMLSSAAEGTLSSTDMITLAEQTGVNIQQYATKTVEGWKVSSEGLMQIGTALEKQYGNTYDIAKQLVDSFVGDGKMYQSYQDLEEAAEALKDENGQITEEYKEQYKLLTQMANIKRLDPNDPIFNFMDQDSTDGFANGTEQMKASIDTAVEALKTLNSGEKIDTDSFYNMFDFMYKSKGEQSDMDWIKSLGFTDKAINTLSEKAGYTIDTYEKFVQAMVTQYGSLNEIDGDVLLEMGFSMEKAGGSMQASLKQVADKQIEFLEGIKNVLLAMDALEALEDVNLSFGFEVNGQEVDLTNFADILKQEITENDRIEIQLGVRAKIKEIQDELGQNGFQLDDLFSDGIFHADDEADVAVASGLGKFINFYKTASVTEWQNFAKQFPHLIDESGKIDWAELSKIVANVDDWKAFAAGVPAEIEAAVNAGLAGQNINLDFTGGKITFTGDPEKDWNTAKNAIVDEYAKYGKTVEVDLQDGEVIVHMIDPLVKTAIDNLSRDAQLEWEDYNFETKSFTSKPITIEGHDVPVNFTIDNFGKITATDENGNELDNDTVTKFLEANDIDYTLESNGEAGVDIKLAAPPSTEETVTTIADNVQIIADLLKDGLKIVVEDENSAVVINAILESYKLLESYILAHPIVIGTSGQASITLNNPNGATPQDSAGGEGEGLDVLIQKISLVWENLEGYKQEDLTQSVSLDYEGEKTSSSLPTLTQKVQLEYQENYGDDEATDEGSTSAKGNVSLQSLGAALAQGTLMGELGPELYVQGGRYHIAGANGPEFVNLRKDAIVFNHLQTARLLSNGKVGSHGSPVTNEHIAAGAQATGNVSGFAFANGSRKEAIAAIDRAISIWQGIANTSLSDLLGAGGGGGGGSGNSIKNVTAELVEWYNLTRKIAKIEKDINLLRAERENINKRDGAAYLRNLREETKLLQEQVATTDLLRGYKQVQLQRQANEILTNRYWSKFLTIDENGLLQYIQGNETNGGKGTLKDLQEFIDMSGEEQQEFLASIEYEYTTPDGESLQGTELAEKFLEEAQSQIDAYDELYDSWREHGIDLENLQQDLEKIEQEIRDNQIELEEDIYDIIVEAWEKEIEAMEEHAELVREAGEEYTNGLREAIDLERQRYDQNQKISDREQLQRQLSLLKRSGGSASEIANLEKQLDGMFKDEYFTNQEQMIDNIQKANEEQNKALQEQIRIQQESLEYQKEHGLIWQQVYDILGGTQEAILSFMQGKSVEFFEKSLLGQEDMLTDWAHKVGIYKEEEAFQAGAESSYESYWDSGSIWQDPDLANLKTVYDGLNVAEQALVKESFGTAYSSGISNGKTQDEAYQEGLNNIKSYLLGKQDIQKAEETEVEKTDPNDYREVPYEVWANNKYGVKFRSSMSTAKRDNIIQIIPQGEQVAVLSEHGDWYKIRYQNREGYMMSKFLRKVNGYSEGGIVDYTGLAMVHGSKSKPEAFLNAEQTAMLRDSIGSADHLKVFESLRQNIQAFESSIKSFATNRHTEQSSFTIAPGAITIQVAELADSYDVEELSRDIMNRMNIIATKAGSRSVNRR